MADDVYIKVREQLVTIHSDINKESYVSFKGYNETDGWGGGDILVTTRQPQNQSPGFYPDTRTVVTPYAHEAGWLISKLWELFAGHNLLDHCSKIEFFGRLAEAAIHYQKKMNGGEETAEGIMTAIFYEAVKILEEMSRGKFGYLIVAPGGLIAEDMK